MSDSLLFVNLPVASVAKSKVFFGALGFTFNDQFSDEQTICMKINEGAYFMLLEHEKFLSFSVKKTLADTKAGDALFLTFSVDSRDAVDAALEAAVAAGATPVGEDDDYGFMYSRAFEDLDGQTWSAMWMDPEVASGEKQPEHPATAA